MVLSTDSLTQAQQPQLNPDNYRISYEDWKEAKESYKEAIQAKGDEKKVLVDKFRNSGLFTKVNKIYNEPRKAYDFLPNEDKSGVNKLLKEHQEYSDRIKGNRSPKDAGELLASPATEGALLPLDLAKMAMTSGDKGYLKDFYGKDIDTDKRNLSLQEGIIIYFDKKFTIQYNDEHYRKIREAEAKMTPEEREREKDKNAREGAKKILDFFFH